MRSDHRDSAAGPSKYDGPTIPVIDLAEVLLQVEAGGEAADRAVASMRRCFEVGFFQIVNHAVDRQVVRAAQEKAGAFFALPTAFKERISQGVS